MSAEKFETSLKKLEEIVRRLEGGSLSLEESLKAYEEGVKHAALCAKKLDEAERRVEVLTKRSGGGYDRAPFETEDN